MGRLRSCRPRLSAWPRALPRIRSVHRPAMITVAEARRPPRAAACDVPREPENARPASAALDLDRAPDWHGAAGGLATRRSPVARGGASCRADRLCPGGRASRSKPSRIAHQPPGRGPGRTIIHVRARSAHRTWTPGAKLARPCRLASRASSAPAPPIDAPLNETRRPAQAMQEAPRQADQTARLPLADVLAAACRPPS